MTPTALRSYLGEVLGVFAIVALGCSGVAVAILFGQVADLVSMGFIWGGAVAVAVWLSATFSGAHLNPAVTLAFTIAGKHPWRHLPGYWAAQIVGAFLGATTTLLWFGSAIGRWIDDNGIVRDQPGGELAGMIFAPYSPNPAIIGIDAAAYEAVPIWRGFFVELIGTLMLIIFVVIATHHRTTNAPAPWALPVAIGSLILMLTVGTGALTMTSLNPARDLGPRILLALDGYGLTAFPGPRGGLSMLVTVGAPLIAGLLAGMLLRLRARKAARSAPSPLDVAERALGREGTAADRTPTVESPVESGRAGEDLTAGLAAVDDSPRDELSQNTH